MSEEAAAYAVLGIDIESLGAAVARHWGLGDEVQHMIRRAAGAKPVRTPDSDADMLRIAASAANEAVDAMTAAAGSRVGAAHGAGGAALCARAADSRRAICRGRCRARAPR